MDSKLVLKTIGMICTIIGFGADILSGIVSDKREEIEIREAVAKEVAKQLSITMKRR